MQVFASNLARTNLLRHLRFPQGVIGGFGGSQRVNLRQQRFEFGVSRLARR
jgi:hypothetical protein